MFAEHLPRLLPIMRDMFALHVRWNRMALAMVSLLALYGGWQVFGWPASHRTLIGDLFFFPVGFAAMWAAACAGRRCASNRRLRGGWYLLAVASALYLAGDAAQTVYELAGNKPYPSVADALYLLFYPVMLLGVLRFATPQRGDRQRLRLALDLATVAIGGAVLVIYVVLGPTVVAGGQDPVQTAFSIAYPVGDMVLLVALASVLLRQPPAASRSSLRLLAAGLFFYVIADLVYGYITLHSTYQGGDPVDTLWMIAVALLALAGAVQSAPDARSDADSSEDRRASWAPYLAVAVGFGVLIVNESGEPLMPYGIIPIAAVVLAAVVSVRQYLATRDLLHTQGELSYQSLHDALTGLPNRVLVMDRAERMLVRARRAGTAVAALYVDIDGFKQVNDSLGHGDGDELLRVIASRLQGVMREADTVGRLAGDEFIVLLEDIGLDAAPELVAERICEVLSAPIELSRTLKITASIGIAVGPSDSADELIRNADIALYQAKAAGKNRWVAFEAEMQTAAQDRVELEMDLKDALAREEFFLLYQPIFELEQEKMVGVEALIRWRHPVRGIVPPNTFIGLAEQSGLISDIGEWVLMTACAEIAAWHARGNPLQISVNVSARQLEDDGLVAMVAEALSRSGLEAEALTLEITETALMREPEAAVTRLHALKQLGVRIAIDDFGTGYSSLAYLRQFPVDELKIDRSFVAGLERSADAKALIHTLVHLGKALGLVTLGEGIEQEGQLRDLQRERCDTGQGFLLGRPMEPTALSEFVSSPDRRSAGDADADHEVVA